MFDIVLDLGVVRLVDVEMMRIEVAVRDRMAVIVSRLVHVLRRQR